MKGVAIAPPPPPPKKKKKIIIITTKTDICPYIFMDVWTVMQKTYAVFS